MAKEFLEKNSWLLEEEIEEEIDVELFYFINDFFFTFFFHAVAATSPLR